MSPERYMREKVRNLPFGKCHVNSNWQLAGLAQVIVTRIRPEGNLAVGFFLVDTFCLGVKDAGFNPNMNMFEYTDLLRHFYNYETEFEEISYNEAHNLIYGAISFAEEGGISPSKEFRIPRYILEEDTEDIPLIEYEYGKNGKHFLLINNAKDQLYLHTLQKVLGDDFEYVDYLNNTEDDWDWRMDEDEGMNEQDIENSLNDLQEQLERQKSLIPREPYRYQYPEYPQTLTVKHPFIADELFAPEHFNSLPIEVIDYILSLPADEAASDLSQIILYEIGRTCHAINDYSIDDAEQAALFHSVILLTELKNDQGLKAILEIMRQNTAFYEYHFGDWTFEIMHQALYACGLNHISAIEEYLYQPGLNSSMRSEAVSALAMIVYHHPERRSEIIDVLRKLLQSMVTRLPKLDACDGEFAGLALTAITDMNAVELIPEIKRVFDTGCIPDSICGDCEEILGELSDDKSWSIVRSQYSFPNIYQQYEILERMAEEE